LALHRAAVSQGGSVSRMLVPAARVLRTLCRRYPHPVAAIRRLDDRIKSIQNEGGVHGVCGDHELGW